MEIIDAENISEARKEIEKLASEGKKVVVLGKSIEFNRLILENKKASMLILSHKNKKDKLKQRDSGLNEVLCKIAKDNNTTLAFDLQELQGKEKKEKAEILSRMLQNVKLIKKFKNNFKLLNYKNKSQAFSFLLTLGANTEMVKEAVETK